MRRKRPPTPQGRKATTDPLKAPLADKQAQLNDHGITIDGHGVSIVDLSGRTQTLENFMNRAAGFAPSPVGTSALKDGAVTTVKVAQNAITGVELASLAVNSSHIAAGQIVEAKLADLAVTGPKVAGRSLSGAKLIQNAVTRFEIDLLDLYISLDGRYVLK